MNFLDKHNVRSIQVFRNVIGDGGEVTRIGGHILHLADANEQCITGRDQRTHIIVTDGNNVLFLRGLDS